jgi:hypothetical protein
MSKAQIVRQPLRAREQSSQTLDQRLFLRGDHLTAGLP